VATKKTERKNRETRRRSSAQLMQKWEKQNLRERRTREKNKNKKLMKQSGKQG
jgi:hypothetical protein